MILFFFFFFFNLMNIKIMVLFLGVSEIYVRDPSCAFCEDNESYRQTVKIFSYKKIIRKRNVSLVIDYMTKL